MESRRTAPQLSDDEVALILQRAAALDAAEGAASGSERDGPPTLDPGAVEEAAIEVGLSRGAVRRALAEHHAGALASGGASRRERHGGHHPYRVVASRLVPTTPDQAHRAADRFLHQQTFDLRRRQGERAIYRQRHDLVARLRRRLDLGGTMELAGVGTVAVSVWPAVAEGSRQADLQIVHLDAELRPGRAIAPARVAGGTLLGAAVAFALWLSLVSLGLLAFGAAVVGGLLARYWAERRVVRQRAGEVRETLAAFLDGLDPADPGAWHHCFW